MKKDHVDLENAVVWILDSKTPNGIAEVPLTEVAVEAFRDQLPSLGTVRIFSERSGMLWTPHHVQDNVGGDAPACRGCALFTTSVRHTQPG
jgi:hypothetical protein